jgi:hypothetical protein
VTAKVSERKHPHTSLRHKSAIRGRHPFCVVSIMGIILCLAGALAAQAGPTIQNLAPTSGPVGTEVTISGSGFGATQGGSSIQIGTSSASVVSWSDVYRYRRWSIR